MPRWRLVASVLSVPPVAHPRPAAKPSAVTTVGAGLVPAHSYPKIGLHTQDRQDEYLDKLLPDCLSMIITKPQYDDAWATQTEEQIRVLDAYKWRDELKCKAI